MTWGQRSLMSLPAAVRLRHGHRGASLRFLSVSRKWGKNFNLCFSFCYHFHRFVHFFTFVINVLNCTETSQTPRVIQPVFLTLAVPTLCQCLCLISVTAGVCVCVRNVQSHTPVASRVQRTREWGVHRSRRGVGSRWRRRRTFGKEAVESQLRCVYSC